MAEIRDQIIEEIKKIYDPEIPVNIWDLGLIYDINVDDKNINIEMTFTSPTCPMMEDILTQVKENVESVAYGRNVDVKLVWDPAWDVSRMSEQARIELDLTEQGW
ncbi:MAG: iron-sulfur cluster assembly protein [Alphaproteobacteria bacterium]|nr:iron-sulfur cluster assembly protein [Alphaproteobacteria bacterium]